MTVEGDPRVLDLNGALNVGNSGVVEFIEVFKNETEYLHAMITATQRTTDLVAFAYEPPTLSELFQEAVAA